MWPRNCIGFGYGEWKSPRDFRVKTKEIIVVLDFICNVLGDRFSLYFPLYDLHPVLE